MANQKEEALEKEISEETQAEEAEASEAETPSEEEVLREKVKEWEDKYLRLYAEYENFRKRSQSEKDARYADAAVDVIAAILPVADNLDRALAVEVQSEDAKSMKEGVEMVKKQMDEIFQKLGVREIPAVGEEFDPNLHNAVMHVEEEKTAENTIVEEFMKGYRYQDDRVIRHSMVKVAN